MGLESGLLRDAFLPELLLLLQLITRPIIHHCGNFQKAPGRVIY